MLILHVGFPPADHAVRDFLSKASTQAEAYKRASTFLEVLFDHTTTIVEDNCRYAMDLGEIAQTFRELLTKGQKMQRHNHFREAFYGGILQEAELKLAKYENVCRRISLTKL
jgi:hypothetical protein